MSATIELPNQVRFRTRSARRYLVVSTRHGNATIERRSDNLATARAEYSRHRDWRDDDGRWWRWFLVDTVTGECIDVRVNGDGY